MYVYERLTVTKNNDDQEESERPKTQSTTCYFNTLLPHLKRQQSLNASAPISC